MRPSTLILTGRVQATDCDYYFLNVVGMGFVVDAGLSAQHVKFIGGADGEFRGRTPAHISCLHQDLTIFVSPTR